MRAARPSRSVPVFRPQGIAAVLEAVEISGDRRMIDRLLALVMHQVLLADVSDVALLRILREQMIEGLVLRGTDRLRNGFIPFIAVGEDRIDIKDYPRKSNMRWRTTSPMPKRAWAMAGRVDEGFTDEKRSICDMAAI